MRSDEQVEYDLHPDQLVEIWEKIQASKIKKEKLQVRFGRWLITNPVRLFLAGLLLGLMFGASIMAALFSG